MFEPLKFVISISHAHSIINQIKHRHPREFFAISEPIFTNSYYLPASPDPREPVLQTKVHKVMVSDFLQAWSRYQRIYLKSGFTSQPFMKLCINFKGIWGVLKFLAELPYTTQYITLNNRAGIFYRHNLKKFKLEYWSKDTEWVEIEIEDFERFKQENNLLSISQLLDEMEIAINEKIYLPICQLQQAMNLIKSIKTDLEDPDYDE